MNTSFALLSFFVRYSCILICLLISLSGTLLSQYHNSEDTLRMQWKADATQQVIYALVPSVSDVRVQSFLKKGSVLIPAEYRIHSAGAFRGIPVVGIEITSNSTRSLQDSIVLILQYGLELPKHAPKTTFPASLTRHISNSHRLSSIKVALQNSSVSLQNSSTKWQNASLPTVRLQTTKEGIAYITGRMLIDKNSAFLGASRRTLKLYHRQTEVRLYNSAGESGTLLPTDTLFFMGNIAKGAGDEFLNEYTSQAAFFLRAEENTSPGLRYERLVPSSFSSAVQHLQVSLHKEEDRLYHLGDIPAGVPDEETIHRTEKVAGEGWYWRQFQVGREVSLLERLQPVTDSLLRIQVRYKGLTDNRFYNPDHAIQFYVNDSLYEQRIFNGTQAGNVEITLRGNAIHGGDNRISMFAPGAPGFDIPNPNGSYTEDNALDFYRVSGSVLPLAYKNTIEGEIHTSGDHIVVEQLSSSRAIALDTLNHTIMFGESRLQGIALQAAAYTRRLGNGVSLIMGDTSFFSRLGGVVVGIYQPELQTARFFLADSAEQQLFNALEQAPQGSIVMVACATGRVPSAALLNRLSAWGLSSLPPLPFVAAGEKGGTSFFAEHAFPAIDKRVMLPKTWGKQYNHRFSLANALKRHIRAVGIDNLEVASVQAVQPTNILALDTKAEYCIIAHPEFMQVAEQFAAYRQTTHNITTRVVNIEEIYNEFSDGYKNPVAIREFLRYTLANWQQPPMYVTLFGDACWDMRGVHPETVKKDFVPSFGRPVSDYWYTLLDDDTTDITSDIIIGRISIEKAEEGEHILSKIREHESAPDAAWMKIFLFLAGGQNDIERASFSSDNRIVAQTKLAVPPLCAAIDTVFKNESSNSSSNQATEIRRAINAGAAWVNYVGHASPTVFDMDFGSARDLNNKGRYPLLATFSCQTAAFAEPNVTAKNEDFVREKDRGFVGALGTSGFGNQLWDRVLLRALVDAIALDSSRNMAEILHDAKMRIIAASPVFLAPALYNTILQYGFIGDPLTRFSIEKIPDLYISPAELQYQGNSGGEIVRATDSVLTIRGMLRNKGTHVFQNILVRAIRHHANTRDTASFSIFTLCEDREFQLQFPLLGKQGEHFFTFEIDPDSTLEREIRVNNISTDTLFVFDEGALALDPQPLWNIAANQPHIRVLSPEENSSYIYEFSILTETGDSTIYNSSEAEITIESGYADWRPEVRLQPNTAYIISVQLRRVGEEIPTATPLFISCTATEQTATTFVQWKMHRPSHTTVLAENTFQFLNQSTEKDALLELRDRKAPITLSSDGSGNNSLIRFEYDGEEYINWQFARGFNIWVFPFTSTTPRTSLYKDTYFVPFDTSANSGNATDVVNFLRDSVRADEYLVVGTCNESFTQFLQGDKNIDELRQVLKNLGAKFADSLGFESSYALVAQNGRAILEDWRPFTSSDRRIQIQDSLVVFNPTAELQTRPIGPAVEWQNIAVSLSTQGNAQAKVQVIGIDTLGNAAQILQTTDSVINLQNISARQYPFLSLRVEGQRSSTTDSINIFSLAAQYQPPAEFIFTERMKPDSLLRGDTVEFDATVKNIALRGNGREFLSRFSITPVSGAAGETVIRDTVTPVLAIGDSRTLSFAFATDNFASRSQVRLQLNSGRAQPEFYSFNNTSLTALTITEDEEAPTIRILADGREVVTGDYVARRPELRITMEDRSLLPILQNSKLRLIVNGRAYPHEIFTDYEFRPINQGRLKAEIVTNVVLDFGENFIRVVGDDASGNRTIQEVIVVVSSTPNIERTVAVPNPFISEVTFSFDFADEVAAESLTVRIADRMGKVVKTMAVSANIGRNSVAWDGRDESGNLLADGVYYAFITGEGSFGVPIKFTIPCILAK